MADTILDTQKAPILVAAVDASGNPVPLPAGSMAFSLSDASIASVDSTDPANPMFVTSGKLGTVTLTATFTPADGSPALVGTDDITVSATPLPAAINVTLGVAVPR